MAIGNRKFLQKRMENYFDIIEESFSNDYLYNESTPFWFFKVKK